MRTIEHLDRATSIKKLRDFSHHWNTLINQWNEQGLSNVERQYAQPFWQDFLACFGINGVRTALYERRAKRSNTGGAGFIDFFMPSMVIGEAKSLGKDLRKAQEQVDDYLSGGSVTDAEFPKYSIVTNFQYLHLKRLDGTAPDLEISISDIADYYDAFLFLIGKETITKKEEEEASIQAAELMAGLYTSIMGEDIDLPVGEEAAEDAGDEDERSQQTSILMTRLLFLLYGDDANLWESDLFYRWVDEETTPSSLGAQLNQLFDVLNTPKNRRSKNIPELMAQFPYVNGSLFADSLNAEFFTPETREALLQACGFRWNRISVSVFGAMFQLVKSKEARRAAGEHYTSEKNILKTIGPLFLDDYRSRADRLINNKGTNLRDIDALLNEMASNIYCDPACGGGNFLNVAYAKLREIETDLLVERQKRGAERTASFDISFDQKLSINQFWGFEINWWPAKIAETAMFLVDHQANLKLAAALGDAPERLPIKITAHIVHGNALRLNWQKTLPEPTGQTYIFGNPPFIGQYTKTPEQTQDMKDVWGKDYDGYLDYVTAWHKKSLDLLENRNGAFAFVTTNSIIQGQPVDAFFTPIFNAGWRIKFAHRTFAWDSEAPGQAAVHCVIVGFTREMASKAKLWDYPELSSDPVELPVSKGINAYLVDAAAVIVDSSRKIISPVIKGANYGLKPADGGNLVPKAGVSRPKDDAVAMKYIRKFVGAKELIHDTDRWCLWMADSDFDPADINRSSFLKEHVQGCKTFRENSTPTGDAYKLKDTPHLFRLSKSRVQGAYLCVPRHVSENRLYFISQRFEPDVICGDANFQIEDADGLQFALLSSSMFMVWQKTVGGRIKSDYRFANTLTWNTFPVPELTDKQRAEIIKGGEKVLAARALHPERSLSEHYEPLGMAPELIKAHNVLDKAVDAAFGSSRRLTIEAQRLELLFKSYQELTKEK